MFIGFINIFAESYNRPIIIDGVYTGYSVSFGGNIYKCTSQGFEYVKPSICSHGYFAVTLYFEGFSHQYLVHRLVALTFIPNPKNKPEVNHKDGNKLNNEASNLEWSTNKENMIHAVKTGLHQKEKHVYTDEQIHEVCRLLQEGLLNNKQIAELVGVNYTLIRDLKFRGKHKQITSLYNINNKHVGYKKYRDKILSLMEYGYSNSEIVEILDIPIKDIRHIEYCRFLFNKNNKKRIHGRFKRVDRNNTDKNSITFNDYPREEEYGYKHMVSSETVDVSTVVR